ncbi:MAG: pilin [Patescibacteria group bacterium]|nr:pilin [Patescibacteria group bacterium]
MKKYLYHSTILATSIKDIIFDGPCGKISETGDEKTIFYAACNTISGLISWVFIAAGFLAVIFIIYGGYTMLVAGGDSSKIENGKKMIIWAIVGIVVVALARFAVYFVIGLIDPPPGTPVPQY